MSTSPTTAVEVEVDVEVVTCQTCQEVTDLAEWPCCGEIDSCAECCEYNQTCDDCRRWEDRGMSTSTW